MLKIESNVCMLFKRGIQGVQFLKCMCAWYKHLSSRFLKIAHHILYRFLPNNSDREMNLNFFAMDILHELLVVDLFF